MPDAGPADDSIVARRDEGRGDGSDGADQGEDDSGFLERVMRYLDDDLPKKDVLKLGHELAIDAEKRDTFVRLSLTSAIAQAQMRGMAPHRILGGDSPAALPPPGGQLARYNGGGGAAEAVDSEIIFLPSRSQRLAERDLGSVAAGPGSPAGQLGGSRRTLFFVSGALILLAVGAFAGWRFMLGPHPTKATALPAPLVFYGFAETDGGDRVRDTGSGPRSYGTIHGGVERVVDPLIGPALRFDGKSGYVDLGAPAKLNFVGSVTLSAWVQPTRLDQEHDIVSLTSLGGSVSEMFLRISRGRYEAGMWGSPNIVASFDRRSLVSAGMDPAELGKWVHVAAVHDGTSWRLYHNGNLAAVLPTPYGTVRVPSAWWIGATPNPPKTKYFAGAIARVGIYHVPLTDAQVAELARLPMPPPSR